MNKINNYSGLISIIVSAVLLVIALIAMANQGSDAQQQALKERIDRVEKSAQTTQDRWEWRLNRIENKIDKLLMKGK